MDIYYSSFFQSHLPGKLSLQATQHTEDEIGSIYSWRTDVETLSAYELAAEDKLSALPSDSGRGSMTTREEKDVTGSIQEDTSIYSDSVLGPPIKSHVEQEVGVQAWNCVDLEVASIYTPAICKTFPCIK